MKPKSIWINKQDFDYAYYGARNTALVSNRDNAVDLMEVVDKADYDELKAEVERLAKAHKESDKDDETDMHL